MITTKTYHNIRSTILKNNHTSISTLLPLYSSLSSLDSESFLPPRRSRLIWRLATTFAGGGVAELPTGATEAAIDCGCKFVAADGETGLEVLPETLGGGRGGNCKSGRHKYNAVAERKRRELLMAQFNENFAELVKLAHDRSEAGRLKLADKIAEIFLSGKVALDDNEEKLVNELIDDLLRTNDTDMRKKLVRVFVDVHEAPRRLALYLATDNIDVASQVLKKSQSLTDDDLIMIVHKLGVAHACAVAEREKISSAVADALVVTGDIRIMQTVARNLGAHLSPRAISLLAETSRLTAVLQEAVLKRPELTGDIALNLYWWTSRELRKNIIERFGFSNVQVEGFLNRAIEQKLNDHLLERQDESAMLRVADWLEARGSLNVKIIPQILRMSHYQLFSIILSKLCNLDLPLVEKIVVSTGGRLLAVLCRALNIDKASFVSIFLLSRGARMGDQIVHPHELSLALVAWENINSDNAEKLLQTWRQNPEYIFQRTQDEASSNSRTAAAL